MEHAHAQEGDHKRWMNVVTPLRGCAEGNHASVPPRALRGFPVAKPQLIFPLEPDPSNRAAAERDVEERWESVWRHLPLAAARANERAPVIVARIHVDKANIFRNRKPFRSPHDDKSPIPLTVVKRPDICEVAKELVTRNDSRRYHAVPAPPEYALKVTLSAADWYDLEGGQRVREALAVELLTLAAAHTWPGEHKGVRELALQPAHGFRSLHQEGCIEREEDRSVTEETHVAQGVYSLCPESSMAIDERLGRACKCSTVQRFVAAQDPIAHRLVLAW
mmetsp:Transcript_14290/g.33588  ORF Transcript_14290/g.33588 Transcript_14290/m.33588 type:complete len:278 (+) Transcript_14290:1016-1849(+)